MKGMAPWNPPKYSPTTLAPFQLIRGMARPLQTATAKASMDSPTAMINSSVNDIRVPSGYQSRKMPWSLHTLRISSGQMLACTSPTWARSSSNMHSRDWPMPPPMV